MTVKLLLTSICLYLISANILFYFKNKTGEVRLNIESFLHLNDSENHFYRVFCFALFYVFFLFPLFF